jgi:hypothetical protein
MKRIKDLKVQFGPYPEHEAEEVKEETLASKEFSIALEKLLRGDIDSSEFLSTAQFITESVHADLKEKQRELQAESIYESVEEDV